MAKQRERKTKPGVYKQAVAGVLLILTLLSAYFAGLACITPPALSGGRGGTGARYHPCQPDHG